MEKKPGNEILENEELKDKLKEKEEEIEKYKEDVAKLHNHIVHLDAVLARYMDMHKQNELKLVWQEVGEALKQK